MIYETLGHTDLKVSKICLGTMTFGEQNTEADGHQQLDYALDQGINFIDTAEMYAIPKRPDTQGSTERIIGKWIQQRKNRDKYILASKITGPSYNLNYIRDPLNFSPKQIRKALEGSLRRLQTDYIDLYQLHWPERSTNYFGQLGYRHKKDESWEDNFLEILQTMQELIRSGKIRYFGISNETPWGLMHFIHLAKMHNLPKCVSIQNPYNLLNRSFEVGLAEIAIRERSGLLAYSPMAFGLLSGKYHRKEARPEARINQYKDMARYNGQQAYRATSAYLQLAQQHGLTLAQMSLAFINSRDFLTSNIIGATNMEQLTENIDSIKVELPKVVLKGIEKIHAEFTYPAP